jgi:hypothetical protein
MNSSNTDIRLKSLIPKYYLPAHLATVSFHLLSCLHFKFKDPESRSEPSVHSRSGCLPGNQGSLGESAFNFNLFCFIGIVEHAAEKDNFIFS